MPASPLPALPPAGPVVILSGAGLSAASGVPTFRGPGGWWRGRQATELATPEAFEADPDLVRAFYGERRERLVGIQPNDGHRALVRLQAALGPERVVLVTQNVDGLLHAAGRELGLEPTVLEMHGTLWQVRCARSERHPHLRVDPTAPDPRGACAVCGALLRPAVVWFGEVPLHMDEIHGHLARCELFVSVGTSGLVYPAAGFAQVARRHGARCLEINPDPTGGAFDLALAEGAETALPRLVQRWLGRD